VGWANVQFSNFSQTQQHRLSDLSSSVCCLVASAQPASSWHPLLRAGRGPLHVMSNIIPGPILREAGHVRFFSLLNSLSKFLSLICSLDNVSFFFWWLISILARSALECFGTDLTLYSSCNLIISLIAGLYFCLASSLFLGSFYLRNTSNQYSYSSRNFLIFFRTSSSVFIFFYSKTNILLGKLDHFQTFRAVMACKVKDLVIFCD